MTEPLGLDRALVIVDVLGFTIADAGLFASAIGRPDATVFGQDAYPDLPTKAAAMMESLARNHALVDGNKRTAWMLTLALLEVNGCRLVATVDDAEAWVLAVAQGHLSVAESAAWISGRL